MIDVFNSLTDAEIEAMHRTPILITILVAGADNDIDKAEINEAVSVAKLTAQRSNPDLIKYFTEVASGFRDKLKVMIQQFPTGATARNAKIIAELEQLNTILPKLDADFSNEFYISLKDMAKKIAEASGGLLGYLSVGYEESKLIGLDMILNPANNKL